MFFFGKKLISFLLFIAFFACVFSAIPVANAETVLRRSNARVKSLDPAFSQDVAAAACVMVPYECLLEYDYHATPYKLNGSLAEDTPELSQDGRTYTFKIKSGKFFGPDKCFGVSDDGKPRRRELTAEDFVYSLKRLADAKISSPGYWLIENKVVGIGAFREASMDAKTPTDYSAPVLGLRAPDDRTFVIELDEPNPDFLWMLAMSFAAAVPREAVEFYKTDFDSVAVGTGLYRLEKFRRNHVTEFRLKEKNDDGLIDRIAFYVVDDPITRWLMFLNGELDISGISRDNWDAVIKNNELDRDLFAKYGLRHFSKPGTYIGYVGFNLDDPVVGKNKKLRQALSRAFNSDEWTRFNNGRVIPANSPVPLNFDGWLETPHPYSFDLDDAKRLLAEAGYPGGIDPAAGKRLELTLEVGETDSATRESVELIASFWAKIGVSVKLNYNNWPSFLEKTSKREAQMFRIGWMADYPSALNFLQLFASKNASPGQNRSNYSNPEYDALYAQAERETDRTARLALIRKMQEIVREDCPWVFLHYDRTHTLVSPDLENFVPHDYSYGMEKHMRKKQK